MASKIDRIANLLVSGLKPASIAQIVSVSPSYISNLLKDEDFQAHIQALAQEKLDEGCNETEEAKFYVDKLAGAEHTIVNHLLERLPYMADNHAIMALNTVGSRRDAMMKANLLAGVGQALQANGGTVRMVEISIPSVAIPDVQFGKNNEVVSIGSRAITPMPVAALQRMMDAEVNLHEALEQL
jgi:hypothetical protein